MWIMNDDKDKKVNNQLYLFSVRRDGKTVLSAK